MRASNNIANRIKQLEDQICTDEDLTIIIDLGAEDSRPYIKETGELATDAQVRRSAAAGILVDFGTSWPKEYLGDLKGHHEIKIKESMKK